MNQENEMRLNKLMEGVDDGTNPLTPEDIHDAMMIGALPIDAPSVEDDPMVAQFVREVPSWGTQFCIDWNTVIATLEERLERKLRERKEG